MIAPSAYLLLSAVLFGIGVVGVVARKNVLIILMSVELMLNGVNVAFVAAGSYLGDAAGGVFAFMVMTVAAAEAAVGLALLIALYRLKETIDITELKVLKW
ncbi:MAG: NADH-quinone oxidoreductase subunit NuoK [Desulfobacteria bacterium]|nr:NADH-quinone oxidoreductase subunit NuoK [Deltaproteobacteria bacterium]OYV76388.1 MAG: NADH-quinone oxidoreductase subunit K [Deltaproteobacteria bacterium 21-66-5]HQT96460.1 NADH-quinone oxidoreductase subunit NuoK [Thermodesulfobacteriota bacterium]HQU12938.1 NADH-quinone oxidoreductase subunit NuoK [Thermodesulfobacteriota bacterium]